MITVTHIKLSCITSQKQPNNFFNPYLCLYNLPSGNLLCGIGYGCSYTPPIQVCLIIFYSLWACTGIEWEWRKKPFIPYVLLLSKTKKCLWFWNFLFMLLLQCKTCMHEHWTDLNVLLFLINNIIKITGFVRTKQHDNPVLSVLSE